jgi:hypothetical protein
MAKPSKCPACGELRFKKNKATYECQNPKCRAVGWLGSPKGIGSGKGKVCPRCGQETVRKILTDKRLRIKIRFCTNSECEAFSIRRLKKP